jgi:hypothetical protein
MSKIQAIRLTINERIKMLTRWWEYRGKRAKRTEEGKLVRANPGMIARLLVRIIPEEMNLLLQ